MFKDYRLLINNQWVDGERWLEVKNPYNQELLGKVPEATGAQLGNAIGGAAKAFKVTKTMPAHRRAKILENTSNLIDNRKEELAETIALEAGKPITLARSEVERANDIPTFRADNAPYGGVKESGIGKEGVKYAIGKEGVKYAIEEMTQPKFICFNLL